MLGKYQADNSSGGRFDLSITNTGVTDYLLRGATTNSRVSSTGSYNDDKWHHSVAVRNGQSLTVYIDGQFIGSNSGLAVNSNLTGTNPFLIGDRFPSGNPFNGFLDEVVIWKRALNATEVKDLYVQTKQGRSNPVSFTVETNTTNALPILTYYSDSNKWYTPYTLGVGASLTTAFQNIVTNTCTWLGNQNWLIKFSDFCNITSVNDMRGYEVNITRNFGTGYTNVTSTGRIYNYSKLWVQNSSDSLVYVSNNGPGIG
jgi:hypothetical protein